MKLFLKKKSPKEGIKQKRSSRGFDIRRRSSASNVEDKYALLDSVEMESRSQLSIQSTSPSEVERQRAIDPADGKIQADSPAKFDATKNEIMQFSEAFDAAHSSAKIQRGSTERIVEVGNDGSEKIAFSSSEVETRDDPPGDQKFQYKIGSTNGDQGAKGILKEDSPTPRKTPTKTKIMGFLRSPRHKKTPSKAASRDPLNTTIETSPSSDSEDPQTSTSNSSTTESRDAGDEPKEKKTPIRKGPVEISNINLSRLIKRKNAPKKEREPSVLKPLKANRSRPPAMSMSKRNEEQFQRYIQRQNRGRKVRESQLKPSFH